MGDIVRALCVDRHPMLAEHLARLFGAMGLETAAAVGLDHAVIVARATRPAVVFCDYDLLATMTLGPPERDELLARGPVIAVSLTRYPHEVNVDAVPAIAGFFYLPTITRESLMSLLASVRRVPLAFSPPAMVHRAGPAPSPRR